MNFDLTEEQRMTRNMVRDFANDVIKPRAIEIDVEAKFPNDIFEEM
ncbi:MAG TPA: acyl-CoA dehydrogenase family protein, partial [Pseudogracilibacillus sp.]|nr:acyl-CoA dehydrogenase family protein [Pseudogracilibacillus sp.]